ncbi:MFS transporter, partial [Patescibacteria group bacterium]|nr:MFS transporter [Patescibacteria group bacterium]
MLGIFENHHNLYSWFPKMEKTTFDVSLVHFLLMFGYKLFSLYYPLFLISNGFSILNVGSIYLLTYSVIAVSSVIINYYIHNLNPSKVASHGIAGYGIFALLMLLGSNIYVFYFAQIVLGISAATWLVSLRLILMRSKTDSKSRSFGWFYSMPHYASAIAPLIGGVVILKFGFVGVFVLSVLIQFANAIYAYKRLNGNSLSSDKRIPHKLPGKSLKKNYIKVFRIIKSDGTFVMILMSILTFLILGGIYRAFFVLFMEDLSFSETDIIRFISIISVMYLPLSILLIKIIEKLRNKKIISGGIIIEGIVTIVLGIFASVMNLFGLFVLMMIDSLGAMAFASGKSSYLSKKFKDCQE